MCLKLTTYLTECMCVKCLLHYILSYMSKQALKCHIVTKHSEKVTTYQCSKCLTTCSRLDNMRRHIKKHPGQTDTPKTIMYEIKQMSPEPQRPKRQRKKSPIALSGQLPISQLYSMLHSDCMLACLDSLLIFHTISSCHCCHYHLCLSDLY